MKAAPLREVPERHSGRPFPSYRFVPGQAPHPTRHPNGHSYNQAPVELASFDPADWAQCEQYLYGIDLFNHRYWWEAHEALEAVWVAAGRQSRTGRFVQGLIQVSVAHLKRFQGMQDVATHMARAGLDKLGPPDQQFLGIDVGRFRSAVRSSFADPNGRSVVIELHKP